MSIPLVLTIPNAGLLSMLDYIDSGISIKFSYIGFGDGRQKVNADTLVMGNLMTKIPVTSGLIDRENMCLSITAMGQAAINHEVNEIGLFGDNDELIAIISKTENYYFKTDLNNFFVFTCAVAFSQELEDRSDKIKLSFAPNEQLLQALMNLHLRNSNPHPYYKNYAKALIQAHLDAPNPHDMYALRDHVALTMQYLGNRLDVMYRIFNRLIQS